MPPGRVPRRPHGRAPRRPRGGGVPPVVFVAGGALALLLLGAVLVLGRGEDPARPARAVRRPPAVRSARPAVRAAPPAEGPSPSGEARSPSERALRVFAGDDAAEVETPEEEAERLRRVDAVYAEELEAARRADEEGSAGAQRPGEDAGD
ncbi:MAG: hypothetical protein D6731_06455 [Planctomycetota bacterium]|nr:MAG: hypothetical protein D6731_06455 [Planctomycetota bacterium]